MPYLRATLAGAIMIIIGDLHLTASTPVCRTDDFIETQQRKLQWVNALRAQGEALICTGDVFDTWNIEAAKLPLFVEHLKDSFYYVYGNHDLPYHAYKHKQNSALYALDCMGIGHELTDNPTVLDGFQIIGFPYGIRPVSVPLLDGLPSLMVCHPDAVLEPNTCQAYFADCNYDYIIVGHNHQTWQKGNIICPGSFTRQEAVPHTPSAFVWDTLQKTFKQAYVPLENAAVSFTHLEHKKAATERLTAFVETLKTTQDVHATFKQNLETLLQNHPDIIKEIVWGCYEKK